MNVFEAIKSRRSVRKFQSRKVEREKLMRVLEAGRLSPSACNLQPWRFIVVDDPEIIRGLGKVYGGKWLLEAPIILVACGIPNQAWRRGDDEEYWKVDVAIAMQDMILTAWEEGLGTCWIANFDEAAAKELLNIPSEMRVLALTPLGYAAEEKGKVTDRKPLDKLVSYNDLPSS